MTSMQDNNTHTLEIEAEPQLVETTRRTRKLQRAGETAAGSSGYGGPIYNYYTGSCSCAEEAYSEIMDVANDISLNTIPLTDQHDDLDDCISQIVHCVLDFLNNIDCGCDEYVKNNQIPPAEHTNKKISTYQCCCDVQAIRDVALAYMNEISLSWSVDMLGRYDPSVVEKLTSFHRYDNIKIRIDKALGLIGKPYIQLGVAPEPSCYSSMEG